MNADDLPVNPDVVDSDVDPVNPGGLTRRQFLQAMAATSAVSAVAFTGCQPGHPIQSHEFSMQSRPRLAEDVLSAYENNYATTCRGCDAGCGLLVRVIEGRAKKIEGNPDHPVNRGKSCAIAQSVVQEEYLPDRIQGPMRRNRSTNTWTDITWDDAITELVARLREVQGRDAVMLTGVMQGQRGTVVERFTRAYGAQWLTLNPLDEAPFREAARRVFGQEQLPTFDIQNARMVLSFGADFLESWLSPVRYSSDYGVFRQGNYRPGQFQPRQGRPRGYLIHVEPRMSATAANADEWVPVRPGTEGLLAMGIAQAIIDGNLGDPEGTRAVNAGSLRSVSMEQIARDTGVSAERIQHIAREFSARRPSLAIGGGLAGAQTNGTESLSAVLALNLLAGSVGRSGGVIFNPPPAITDVPAFQPTRYSDWAQTADRIRQRQTRLVLIADANPVYSMPGLRFGEALQQAQFVVSFSSNMDETTALADLVLPSHLPLEDWGNDVPEPGPGFQVVSMQQPIVRPMFDTRSFPDVLLTAGAEVGGAVSAALPWRTFQDLLRETANNLQQERRGSVRAPDAERFWTTMLQQGGWWDESRTQTAAGGASGQGFPSTIRPPRYDGAEGDFPYHLVAFPHPFLGQGGAAHVPWLQGLPDPMTSVAWQSWVEVNPKLAQEQGLREGDIIGVESSSGRVEVPVYINPAAPPTVLAIPMGQGHTTGGRYASKDGAQRGVNAWTLIAPLTDETTGSLAYGATRVRIVKTGRRVHLPKFEGTVQAFQVPHEEVIKVTRES